MKPFIIGSGWKMNNTIAQSLALIKNLQIGLKGFDAFPLFVLPPFTALQSVGQWLDKDERIRFGAQNMHWEGAGAFTGEVSAPMLKEVGCTYVELNHQERRAYFGETNDTANRKIRTALKFGLKPILCLGEEELLADSGVRSFLRAQVAELLAGVSAAAVADIIFAYEPRWAIGKADAAPASHVKKVHGIIREVLAEEYGAAIAEKTYIIYGGSVDGANAVEIAVQPGVNGLFIGRAGLNPDGFAAIIKEVAQALRA